MNAPLIGREVVDAYAERWSAPELEAYWRDPAPFEAERARRRAIYDAAMAPHRARVRAAQEARWAAEEAEARDMLNDAAPELYEALRDMVDLAAPYMRTQMQASRLAAARAVLAKARPQ